MEKKNISFLKTILLAASEKPGDEPHRLNSQCEIYYGARAVNHKQISHMVCNGSNMRSAGFQGTSVSNSNNFD